MYIKYVKRIFDFLISLCAIIILSPLFVAMIIVGTIIMGGNPFFTQYRPGKDEKIFKMIKFRSMTREIDKSGRFLPDEERMTPYGKFIRATSLDELPEFFNILKGDMSFVGPRPQLVRDMLFMTEEQRKRHTVKPGLTGLAQSMGRNGLSWENKLTYDLEYINNVTFLNDVKIILRTIGIVFKQEGITEDGMVTAADLGDYLLDIGKVDKLVYEENNKLAEELISKA